MDLFWLLLIFSPAYSGFETKLCMADDIRSSLVAPSVDLRVFSVPFFLIFVNF